ncbi:MvaI/BcnI family restriction endonuclease [Arthrobacter rhombi]|uniref:MvaI/BcnI family restriction endonuclease n=1 Tax=Arthrobacter rhombi TaxID=71253 RepID=UPI003FD1B556
MRGLTKVEQENVDYLTRYDVAFGLIELTETGLSKGILDATQELREFLHVQGVHDYGAQPKGTEFKRYVDAHFLAADAEAVPARASLYRPVTKNGDPRIWFSRLKNKVKSGDLLLVLWIDSQLWVLSLDSVRLATAIEEYELFAELLGPLISPKNQVYEELLEMLTDLHREGYVPAIKKGDTAIGHLIETKLGIQQNSSKNPDYNGVELKSSRARSQRNLTLFAKVADWGISPLGSSGEILDNFGYDRPDEAFQLYCSVSALKPNSQGLFFRVNEKQGHLVESSTNDSLPVVARWKLDGLRNALAKKHADTFWIKADSRRERGQEFLRVHSVIQTSSPVMQQVVPLLERGQITMDHLIKRQRGKTSERGPLFKIKDSGFNELFPQPIFHDLSRR